MRPKVFGDFLKLYIQPPVSVLLYLILFYVLYGLVLFRKGAYNVCRMFFKGGILGGVQNIHHNPYLNGMTVPFDNPSVTQDIHTVGHVFDHVYVLCFRKQPEKYTTDVTAETAMEVLTNLSACKKQLYGHNVESGMCKHKGLSL